VCLFLYLGRRIRVCLTEFCSRAYIQLPKYAHARNSVNSESKSESESRWDRQSVGQSVLVCQAPSGARTRFCCRRTVAVLSIWGAPSNERRGLSFTAVTISSTCCLYLQFYISQLSKESGSLWLPTIYSCKHRIVLSSTWKANSYLTGNTSYLRCKD
jgi:hypothetical protein